MIQVKVPRYVVYKFYDDKWKTVFHEAYDTGNFREIKTLCGRVLSLDDGRINVLETTPDTVFDRLCIECLRAKL